MSSILTHREAKSLSLIAQKLGRTVYYMLKRKEPFESIKFFQDGLSERCA